MQQCRIAYVRKGSTRLQTVTNRTTVAREDVPKVDRISLYLEPALGQEVRSLAAAERRGLNSQIVLLIERGMQAERGEQDA